MTFRSLAGTEKGFDSCSGWNISHDTDCCNHDPVQAMHYMVGVSTLYIYIYIYTYIYTFLCCMSVNVSIKRLTNPGG